MNVHGELVPSNYLVTRNQLYQLSCLSRSLPLPDDDACEQEKADFLDFVSRKAPKFKLRGDPKIEIYNRFCSLTEATLDKWSKKTSKTNLSKPDINSSKACFGYSIKDGGRVQHFVDFCKKASKDVKLIKKNPYAYNRAVKFSIGARVSDKSIYKSMGFSELTDEYIIHCDSNRHKNSSEFVAVKTNGLKIRGVTKNPPARVVLAHRYRRKLFRILLSKRGTKESLNDLPTEFKLSSLNGNERVYSVDLKRATDGISHSFAKWICERLDIPFDLVFEDFFVDGIKVERGLFMGMPLSWCFLSMIHLLICEFVDPKGNFYLKGDDLISVWSVEQYERYQWLLKFSGLILNEKKTFISRDRGTFCEGSYVLRDGCLRLIPTFSYAGLVNCGKDSLFIYDIETLAETYSKRGLSKKRILDVFKVSFSKEFTLLEKAGVDLFEPKFLGGLGLSLYEPGQNLSNIHSIKYVQAVYLGLIDHKNLLVSNAAGRGPNSVKNERDLSSVEYSFAVPKEQRCEHFDSYMSFRRSVASIKDAQFAKDLRKKKLSLSTQIKSLRRQRKNVFLESRELNLGTDKRSLDSARRIFDSLYPTPSSMKDLGFNCTDCERGAVEKSTT
jgi:hypothetical protein